MDQEKVIRKYIILLSLYLDVENKVLWLSFMTLLLIKYHVVSNLLHL